MISILNLLKIRVKKSMQNQIKDIRDVLTVFFRVLIILVIIQSFFENDQLFILTLVWAVWVIRTIFKKD